MKKGSKGTEMQSGLSSGQFGCHLRRTSSFIELRQCKRVVAEQYNGTGAVPTEHMTVQKHVTNSGTRTRSRRDYVPVLPTYRICNKSLRCGLKFPDPLRNDESCCIVADVGRE